MQQHNAIMAAYWNSMILLYVIILDVLYTVSAITTRVHPKDVQIVVGSTVTLTCAVDDIGTNNIYWYRHATQTYLTKDNKVFHQAGSLRNFYTRISVVGDRRQGEFNLNITNASFDDADRYSCVFFDRSRYIGESQAGELKVYEAPAEGFPKCSVAPPRGVGPGTRVTIQCLSKRSTGAPNSRLDWHRWFEMLPGSFIQGNNPKASYAIDLTAQDNGAVFTCVESSPVLDVPRTCHVRPFLIPTNVTVVALQGESFASKKNSKKSIGNASIAAGQEALFSCEAEAIPPATNYTWFIAGELAEDSPKISIEHNGAHLRLTDVQLTDNGTVIKCKAWNSALIEGSGHTVLDVQRSIRSAHAARSHSFPPTNIAYIIGTVALIVLISIVIFIFLRLRNKKLANRRGSDSREANREHIRQVTPFISEPISEPQPMTTITAEEEQSIPESDESEPLRGVTICSTPHAAIVEHLREQHTTEEGDETNVTPPEDTATRVIMVGRLSSVPSECTEYKEQPPHNDTDPATEQSNQLYTKPLKRGKKSKARRGILKSDISFPISASSETDSIYMNCPNVNSVNL